jgi:hypothetical protein
MRRKGIGIGGACMVVLAVSFLIFAVATRFGLDILGPHLVDLMDQVHDATGLFEGVRAADR